MASKILRAAFGIALVWASTATTAADFTFSFETDGSDPDVVNGVPGTVTGRILGLPDDGSAAALQVLIDSYSPDGSLGFPIDATAWFSQFENSFTVVGGDIVAAAFYADNNFENSSLDQLFINIPIYETGGTNYASLGSNNSTSIWNNQGLGGITFTRIGGAIPEPETWAFMLLGFGAIGLAFRRRGQLLAAA